MSIRLVPFTERLTEPYVPIHDTPVMARILKRMWFESGAFETALCAMERCPYGRSLNW